MKVDDPVDYAHNMIYGELGLLHEDMDEDLEMLAGSIRAVLTFTYDKAPMPILAVNLITSVLSSVTAEKTLTNLEELSDGD